MSSSELVILAENYVRILLADELIQRRPFHNLAHTIRVVQKCMELATYYTITGADREALLIAAWFHDTGYLHGNINHEEESSKIALEFLHKFHPAEEFLMNVKELIIATKLPAKPTSLLQEILCDADLHHLASIDYMKCSTLLCQELQQQDGITISEQAWNRKNISFFKSHHYFTDYAIRFWEGEKQKNLSLLINRHNA